ncbi:MAG: hypothetical protein N3A65_09440 [candidate division WOR-3 bacterium]|nr:hypothetical protein [candidate division WOR-3 bacterium]
MKRIFFGRHCLDCENILKIFKRAKPFIGLIIIFSVLFLPRCITVPAMYETAETKDEKRIGFSTQYGEGNYSLCGSSYNYKYGGVRADWGYSKKQSEIIETGLELGGSINGVYEIPDSNHTHKREIIILQTDVRLTGKVVTATDPLRMGIKLAPGFLLYGCASRSDGNYDVGGEFSFLSYGALLVGIGNPEFFTIGIEYYPFLYYITPKYYSFLTLTYHHKKYSVTGGCLLPFGKEESLVPKFHYSIGLGIHY